MVQNLWILDVLTDLETFASSNGLPALAEQLGDARMTAAAEIGTRKLEAHAQADGKFAGTGPTAGGLGGQQRA